MDNVCCVHRRKRILPSQTGPFIRNIIFLVFPSDSMIMSDSETQVDLVTFRFTQCHNRHLGIPHKVLDTITNNQYNRPSIWDPHSYFVASSQTNCSQKLTYNFSQFILRFSKKMCWLISRIQRIDVAMLWYSEVVQQGKSPKDNSKSLLARLLYFVKYIW